MFRTDRLPPGHLPGRDDALIAAALSRLGTRSLHCHSLTFHCSLGVLGSSMSRAKQEASRSTGRCIQCPAHTEVAVLTAHADKSQCCNFNQDFSCVAVGHKKG